MYNEKRLIIDHTRIGIIFAILPHQIIKPPMFTRWLPNSLFNLLSLNNIRWNTRIYRYRKSMTTVSRNSARPICDWIQFSVRIWRTKEWRIFVKKVIVEGLVLPWTLIQLHGFRAVAHLCESYCITVEGFIIFSQAIHKFWNSLQ